MKSLRSNLQQPEAPDFAEPPVGVRAWWVALWGDELRLVSLVPGRHPGFGMAPWPWIPRRAVRAKCLTVSMGMGAKTCNESEVPRQLCTCGYYMSHQINRLRIAFAAQRSRFVGKGGLGFCVGEVAAWGRVVRHERGMRSAFAYPRSLVLAGSDHGLEGDLGSGLAAEYGVPVTVVPRDLANTWGTSEWDSLRDMGALSQFPSS